MQQAWSHGQMRRAWPRARRPALPAPACSRSATPCRPPKSTPGCRCPRAAAGWSCRCRPTQPTRRAGAAAAAAPAPPPAAPPHPPAGASAPPSLPRGCARCLRRLQRPWLQQWRRPRGAAAHQSPRQTQQARRTQALQLQPLLLWPLPAAAPRRAGAASCPRRCCRRGCQAREPSLQPAPCRRPPAPGCS